ncbi:hypothetical protein D3C73_533260 [compost metagenome]
MFPGTFDRLDHCRNRIFAKPQADVFLAGQFEAFHQFTRNVDNSLGLLGEMHIAKSETHL